MAVWTKPVDNRSPMDFATNNKRAYINYPDLNRIEQNIQYLADLFSITLSPTPKFNWVEGEFPNYDDRDRILDNTEKLREYAIANLKVPNEDWYYPLPIDSLESYQEFNAIENMLLRIYRANARRDIPDFEIIMPELIISQDIGVL